MPTLGHRAYLELREKLACGEFPPGSKLVNRTVSQLIGMSMTPVREAMARLASEGLIKHVPGGGAFVREINRREYAQLYDLRAVLEPFAAAQAAMHISIYELQEMRAICKDSRAIRDEIREAGQRHATPPQMARWLRNEKRFHELLVRASRNPWLEKIVGDLQLLAFGFNPQRGMIDFLTVGVAQAACRDHARLLKALRARDAELASRLMKRHILIGRKRVLDFLDRAAGDTNGPAPLNSDIN
jgi:DNA-binding GntR family transcriptional regulator